MHKEIEVVYNGSCPICSSEVAVYRRHAEGRALPIVFSDLHETDLARVGLDKDSAARRFHVLKNGQLLSGVPAFIELWSSIPRYRWLARIVGLPVIRTLASLLYITILAPTLYAMHKRRERRAASAQAKQPQAAQPKPAPQAAENESA
ncbi:MAG: DUF393 domain-containing protein [Oceanicola sp.]|nr:DUF393 domain-containing protein [Oceanicola sp.]